MPKKTKTKPDAPGGDEPGIGHNEPPPPPLTEAEKRELFAHHRSRWNEWQAKVKLAAEFGKTVKADLKNDGFTLAEFKIADDLTDDDAKTRAEIEDRLRVAAWLGLPLGSQLEMFRQPDRTPIADRAYEEGKQASIENRRASPPYAPDTEAHRTWMAGYHDHQRELAGGLRAPRSGDESTMAHQ